MVGDTLHDHELAQAIGCRAVLYAGGHQSRERLAAAGAPVIDAIHELDRHLEPPVEPSASAGQASPPKHTEV